MSRLSTFELPINAFIQGASRGIGLGIVRLLLDDENVARVFATSRHPGRADVLETLKREHPDRLHLVRLDVTDEGTIEAAARAVREHTDALELLLNVTGVLHDASRGMAPEKALRDLNPEHLAHSFAVNTIGPMLVAKHFWGLLKHERRAVFANLSARVGSIGDNHLGGWYGYRASKAAQNQFTKTLSIELGRRAKNVLCVALHPGTVDTQLSKPFQANVPAHKLFDPARASAQLLDVINQLSASDSGTFYDWAGEPIEW
ncbi:MAG: SDR family NAD(P)-dependent oxidoreductase [Myxococcota bacterium]